MRLFLVTVGMLALASGCDQRGAAGEGAVRVEVFYATFRPGCLTVTVVDAADSSHIETQQLPVEERNSDDKTVAVFRKADWSRKLRVTAGAREGSCTGPEVATSTRELEVPQKGTAVVYLDLRAEDLDRDGFVSARAPFKGTDCDDEDARVYPGASETCDGKDSNCSGSEDDAPDKRGFYVDADGDGYGNALQVVKACVPPAGAVAEAGDCHDRNASVHPNQAEPRCDGVDDDCDGTADDDFQLGASCEAEYGCAGTRRCAADGMGAVCSRTQTPLEWFVDNDGDGLAGTSVGLTCKPPPGAVSSAGDCHDGSRFLGGPEVCDRLDNNCDGAVDENLSCAEEARWTTRTGLGDGATWEAVSTYAPGKAWLVGLGGVLLHRDENTGTSVSHGCTGNWRSAWARPSDGRVFFGSTQGVLATMTPESGAACDLTTVGGVTGAINGMVGFEYGGVTTVYAVTGDGYLLRWEWREATSPSSTPVVVDRVPAGLRDVHGLGASTLLVVGAEDYQPSTGAVPRVFRLDAATGRLVRENLPANVGTGALRGVFVVEKNRAYAVGDRGLLLERQNGTWRTLTPPEGTTVAPDLLDVVAFDSTTLFVLSNESGAYLHRFDGTAWSKPVAAPWPLLSLDALGPQEQWAVGQGGTLVRWGP